MGAIIFEIREWNNNENILQKIKFIYNKKISRNKIWKINIVQNVELKLEIEKFSV